MGMKQGAEHAVVEVKHNPVDSTDDQKISSREREKYKAPFHAPDPAARECSQSLARYGRHRVTMAWVSVGELSDRPSAKTKPILSR